LKPDVTADPVQGYVSAAELAGFLGKSEMDVARLGKAGVLSRIPNPANRREVLYELKASVQPRYAKPVKFARLLDYRPETVRRYINLEVLVASHRRVKLPSAVGWNC
jgi:hypothetical protein